MSFLVLAGVIVACGGSEKAEKICTPDANVFCRCTDRKEGTKKCKADGNSFEACMPCDGSGDPGPGSGAGNPMGRGDDDDGATRPASTKSGDDDDSTTTTPTTPSTTPTKPSTDPANPTKPSEDTTPTPVPPKTPPSTSSTSGSSSGSSSKPDTSTFPDTPHCKPLTNGAPKIETQKLADTATAPVGGKPNDGLYYQAWAIQFTGEDGESGPTKHFSKGSMEIMGDVGRYVFEDEEGKNTGGGFRLKKVEGKNKVSVEYECPAGPPKEMGFDATDSTLVLYDGTYARVFYRQTKGASK